MSPVNICNIALAHIGDRRITQLDAAAQAANALVRLCAEYYDLSRRQALAAHRWSFAKKAAVLTRNPDAVTLGNYQFSHYLPTDRLRVMELVRGGPPVDGQPPHYSGKIDHFKIVGEEVWTNNEYVAVEYIFDLTDPAKWPPHFQAAVARLLAHYLAGAVADGPGLAIQQLDLYEKNALPNAQYYDSVQDQSGENSLANQETRLAGSGTLRARRNGAGYPYDAHGHTP